MDTERDYEDRREHQSEADAMRAMHPYHHDGRLRVWVPGCPACDRDPKDTTYIAWSLHESIIASLKSRIAVLEARIDSIQPRRAHDQ